MIGWASSATRAGVAPMARNYYSLVNAAHVREAATKIGFILLVACCIVVSISMFCSLYTSTYSFDFLL